MENNNGDKIKIHERVTCLESDAKNVRRDIDSIVNNHLPHIREDIEELQKIMWKGLGALAVLQVGLSVALAVFIK